MHRFRRFGKRDEYTHLDFLAFHHMRQIADHCHIDILAAFDGYSRFLMDAISGVNARGRLSCGLASLHNELRLSVFLTTYNTLKLLTEASDFKNR